MSLLLQLLPISFGGNPCSAFLSARESSLQLRLSLLERLYQIHLQLHRSHEHLGTAKDCHRSIPISHPSHHHPVSTAQFRENRQAVTSSCKSVCWLGSWFSAVPLEDDPVDENRGDGPGGAAGETEDCNSKHRWHQYGSSEWVGMRKEGDMATMKDLQIMSVRSFAK
ncbi:hypothetical protein Q8A73_009842 [Channa argus]|nr:hypothetical protein Q8A73_009842 [Channa argus]